MKLTPVAFNVDQTAFQVTFAREGNEVIAALHADQRLLASVLTMAWKLTPQELLESLVDSRTVNQCEFFRIDYDGEEVTLSEDEDDLTVSRDFFRQVVLHYAAAHLEIVDHFEWSRELSPAVRALL